MKYLFSLFILMLGLANFSKAQPKQFVGTRGHQFFRSGKPYYFMGTNYWYGGIACLHPDGQKRVKAELDFLVKNGVTNVRVMAGAEGVGQINGVRRVEPAFQPEQAVFVVDQLKGLDYLLVELAKRKMTAVIFLSNNWEWSGGFLQYLNWNGKLPDTVMRRKLTWDENRDIVAGFYDCEPCMSAYEKQVVQIVTRVNSITGKPYRTDPAIMAWELANEPRPMRPHAVPAYLSWIGRVATFIKKLDANHLVTTGCEGDIATEGMDVFNKMHQLPGIDYATIHIWPKNWGWFADTAIAKGLPQVIKNTAEYISKHAAAAAQFGKPLVVEEFGLPRNGHVFEQGTPVSLRDAYYESIFAALRKSHKQKGPIAGTNFWAFSGFGKAGKGHVYWQPGDDLLGDPPQEEQGLNSVFAGDESTWKVIRQTAEAINHKK